MQNFENEMENDHQTPLQIPPFPIPSSHYSQTSSQVYTPYYGPQNGFVSSNLGYNPVYVFTEHAAARYHIAHAPLPPYESSTTALPPDTNYTYWENNGISQTDDVAMDYLIQQMRSPQGFSSPSSVSVPSVYQLDPSSLYQPQPGHIASQLPQHFDWFPSSTDRFEGNIPNNYHLSSAQTSNHTAESTPWNHLVPETLTETSSDAPSPSATTVSSGRSSPVLPTNFVDASFPESSEDHADLRERLREVMNSDWKLEGSFEPKGSNYLIQFMSRDKASKMYSCLFWKGSSRCAYKNQKSQHAKTHVRKHIKHRPFVCGPVCPVNGSKCSKRYYAREPLVEHQKGIKNCEFCGKAIGAANLKRHQETASCERGSSQKLNGRRL
ncbi:hypothetical protein FRC20_001955 [Serendipita sp. 405]|nr:hypothetical protein FRC15_002062 [Serendipita sp. 397]KAG8850655.1 hypothetical protein FRC20_001955 [Serendipita sp. 405]